ncbi:tyrosinase cofactor [Streptomyces sp. NPDC053048]|uniref:apotyrosinase chaperone MelC1 n=1 Tax=Streptomyces sp. NPDC053048 TaxID=3365694 RepID=UPI0037D4A325
MPKTVSRRFVLRGTAVAVAGAALAGTAAVAATAEPGPKPTDHSGHGGHGPQAFDETYKGRRIVGKPATGGHEAHHGGFAVTVDGKELHVMQNADGSWISVVNHYQTFSDPLALTRAAVDKLQGATLVPIAIA